MTNTPEPPKNHPWISIIDDDLYWVGGTESGRPMDEIRDFALSLMEHAIYLKAKRRRDAAAAEPNAP